MHTTILMLLVATLALDALHADEPRQQTARLEATQKVELNYLRYLPPNYDKQDSWPLLLFLHGAGERGEDLDLVKVHGPPKLISQGTDFPFIVISPQSPKDRWWRPNELTALLDDVAKNYKVDEDRICVTGLSMGGFGTWALAAYTPRRFAALAPICGGGEPYWARRFKHVPTWVFHGGQDKGRSAQACGRHGCRDEERRRQPENHRLSRCRSRLLDRHLRQPGVLRVVAQAETEARG